jgi:hypothetical protein
LRLPNQINAIASSMAEGEAAECAHRSKAQAGVSAERRSPRAILPCSLIDSFLHPTIHYPEKELP